MGTGYFISYDNTTVSDYTVTSGNIGIDYGWLQGAIQQEVAVIGAREGQPLRPETDVEWLRRRVAEMCWKAA